jgi:hypothetical protein
MTSPEKRKFISTVAELKTPKGYVGRLHRRVSDRQVEISEVS